MAGSSHRSAAIEFAGARDRFSPSQPGGIPRGVRRGGAEEFSRYRRVPITHVTNEIHLKTEKKMKIFQKTIVLLTLLIAFASTAQARNYGICTRSEFREIRREFSLRDAKDVCATRYFYGDGYNYIPK
jgi:hypothetical protein